VVPYIHEFGNAEQKQKWLPGCASGELITAVGMTEPGTGSDLAGIQTTARKDGDHYVINGAKTFISNGQLCDLVVLACRTGEPGDDPHRSLSLFVVEAGHARVHQGQEAREDGHGLAGHQRAGLRGLPGAGGQPAGRAGRGLHHAHEEAAAGAPGGGRGGAGLRGTGR
jgi:alkylation response protein AidB-like acyl-CoA dehydrogenase